MIHGLFVVGVYFNGAEKITCFIKLSEIKKIEVCENHPHGERVCIFYTYKDYKYFTWMYPRELTDAINDLFLINENEEIKKFSKKSSRRKLNKNKAHQEIKKK